MCKVISVINNKGGVGKTTSTGVLSQLLAFLGKKILVIDLDQQSNLSMMLDCYTSDSDEIINGQAEPTIPNITELFKFRYRTVEEVNRTIMKTAIPNLDIIPSSKRHKNTILNININTTGNNNIILKRAIAAIKDRYDYILIDNAPANDVLTVNSMFASDLVIIPVRVEGFSYKGLTDTLSTLNYIKEEHDITDLKFGGAFITQAELQTNVYKDINDNYKEELLSGFYTTPIRKDIKISEVETNFRPVLSYCPDTNAIFDYSKLLLEMNILPQSDALALEAAIS